MKQKKEVQRESADMTNSQCILKIAKQSGIILILGSIYLSIVLKTKQGIPCIFYRITGLKCPGCGMTHAMIELWKGDYLEALRYNALSLTVFPVLCIYLLYRFCHTELNGGKGFYIWEYAVLLVLLLISIGYACIRNIM